MVKQAKILFVIHDVYKDDNTFPLGIAYLAASLRNAGHSVQIYSQDVFHYTNEQLADFLDKNEFDIIGIGFLAARYEETVRPLAKVIYEHKKNAKFILGGHGPSAIPEYCLEDLRADFVLIGEAEKTIIELTNTIMEHGDLNKIPGLVFKKDNEIKINERALPIKDLDTIPFPAWDLFPMKEYTECLMLPGASPEDKTLAVLTSRGCVNKCSFCYRMEKGIRIRSMQNLFEELKYLQEKYNITYFEFEDEMFIPNRERIKEFVTIIKKLPLPVKYYCQTRVELAKDKEILKMLKDSGCCLLNFGLESLDQNVLDLMGKNTKVEDNIIAVENTIEAGIHPGLNFIWGNPGDSVESLNKIVDFLLKYDTQGQLRTIRPPTPYPGCPLYYLAIEQGKLKGPGDFFDKFKNSDRLTVNFTNLSDEEVYNALLEANSRLIKNYFNKRSEEQAQQMIAGFKRVYFPKSLEDIRFRGARHYNKK
ncbi:MAG: radical SAM protein [Candidatus Pacearchaeota archaeon]|jgi:radical SAM superfamily enzyme YgiQ (UPF0313 family)